MRPERLGYDVTLAPRSASAAPHSQEAQRNLILMAVLEASHRLQMAVRTCWQLGMDAIQASHQAAREDDAHDACLAD